MGDQPEIQYFHHGRFKLSGGWLPNAITAYQTYGDPKKPCIVYPSCFGTKLAQGSQRYLIGEGKALDPAEFFIVTFALFCNGESSSPSNTPAPHNGPSFPAATYEDNVCAQYAVLKEHLKVTKIFCVVGFSMGAQEAYHWSVMYPGFVERFVAICGSARTSPHNICFLEGPKNALIASKDFENGYYTSAPQHGLKAFARAFCAWPYGQTWFREHRYLEDGKYPDLEAFLREVWDINSVKGWDANDMLGLIHTWQHGDLSQFRHNGDYERALAGIEAKGLIMPSKTDLYFPPEDSEIEVSHMKNATLVVIDSVWGHTAGGGSNPTDTQFVTEEVKKFLRS